MLTGPSRWTGVASIGRGLGATSNECAGTAAADRAARSVRSGGCLSAST